MLDRDQLETFAVVIEQQSFEKALVDPKQTLDELKQLGWSTDALRFQDLGNRLAKPAAAKA